MLRIIVSVLTAVINVLLLCNEGLLSFVSMACIFAAYVLSSVLHSIFHELGHLAGGLVSGYELLRFNIGWFCFYKDEEDRYRFIFSGNAGRFCVMTPRDGRKNGFVMYNLGGVFMNLLLTAVACPVLLRYDGLVRLLILQLAITGLKKALINGIPAFFGKMPNDGMTVKILLGCSSVLPDYFNYLMAYSFVSRNMRVPEKLYCYDRIITGDKDSLLFYEALQELIKDR